MQGLGRQRASDPKGSCFLSEGCRRACSEDGSQEQGEAFAASQNQLDADLSPQVARAPWTPLASLLEGRPGPSLRNITIGWVPPTSLPQRQGRLTRPQQESRRTKATVFGLWLKFRATATIHADLDDVGH